MVAAVHAIRPIFPGREAVVAASFGLVHGLAFSATLRALHLSGTHLVLALLGFNVGIELMQLIVVGLVLPPLILLAGTQGYRRLCVGTATVTGIAAVGWLGARVGVANPLATAADHLGSVTPPVVLALWLSGLVCIIARHNRRSIETHQGPVDQLIATPAVGLPDQRHHGDPRLVSGARGTGVNDDLAHSSEGIAIGPIQSGLRAESSYRQSARRQRRTRAPQVRKPKS